jgi:signal transduction histidine kinase
VLEASTGRDALALAAAERPHLILLDVNLPDITGFEVCLHLERRRVDIAPIVAAAIESTRGLAAAKNVTIAAHIEPTDVDGDPPRLQQVATNLLTNAIRFTPPDGRVDVTVEHSAGRVQLRVTDTGIGIEAEFLPHVFDLFRQAEGGVSRQQGGLGLGLAIVRQLVEMHGGTVSAASDGPGRGSTFVVQLPMAS